MRALAFLGILVFVSTAVLGQEIVDQWRYTVRRPAEGWQQADFDDADWKEGSGGFGTADTPGSRVGTTWASNRIWLRKSFDLSSIPENPALLIHHDEDAEVHINGMVVATLKNYTTEYIVVPIEQNMEALRIGQNTMAVHCRQSAGGQFIDVHFVDAKNVPELPRPKRSTKPFVSQLITPWGEQVTSENAWTATLFHWFDSSKAQKELGLKITPAEEAIERSVRWSQKNGLI